MDRNEKRVFFKDKKICREFFEKSRIAFGFRTWEEMRDYFGICKSPFQSYVYCDKTLPLGFFEKLSLKLSFEDKEYFQNFIEFRDGNWGERKGGLATARLHPEILREGRKLGARSTKKHMAIKNFDLDMPLTTELCEIIGAFIGDGSLGKYGRAYSFQIAGHKVLDEAYLRYLSQNIQDIFPGVGVWFRKDKRKNAIWMKIYSKQISELLTKRFDFPLGPKTHTVKIPSEILNSPDEFLFAAIRGIFDTDGCVFFDKRKKYVKCYPRITITLASAPLHFQLKEILSNHFPLYTYHRKSNETNNLEIYGQKNFDKWMHLIGFSNQKHLDRIEKALGEN